MPVIIAFTASYEDRPQLKNYTGLKDMKEGILAVKSDIERLSREDGPYSDLNIIVHLDHAQPASDKWLVDEYGNFISSVMWDCSHYSLKDKLRMTKKFVDEYKTRFIVEGAVDEIYNYNTDNVRGEVIDNITEPEVAEEYFSGAGSPRWNVSLKGAFYGISLSHGKYHFLKAILDAVAFEIKLNIDTISDSGIKVKKIILSGGASKNLPLCQVIADVLETPTAVSREKEASSKGVFYLVKSQIEGLPVTKIAGEENVAHTELTPDKKRFQHYRRLYQKYISLGNQMENLA
ncbi:unnamed protein product [marine sediment metagenome]|uniref:Carbohydrate kinase FGGY C-terminal domain-containing protein n=1 Tax=marine sediment metagenome TaxID=412755 RepID=X1ENH5_9ZZZZ